MKLIITHKNCIDGCTAKRILMKNYKDDAQYIELEHSDFDPIKFPDKYKVTLDIINQTKHSEVIMADIVIHENLIEECIKNDNKIVILDHHQTILPLINKYQEKINSGKITQMNISFSENNSKSGAMLTWNYLYPNIEPPLFVKYVCDGDRWAFKYQEKTKNMYAGLLENHQPKEISDETWKKLFDEPDFLSNLIDKGQEIREKYMKEVDSLVKQATPIQLFGHHGFFIKTSMKYKSELGAELAKINQTFGLIVEERIDENLVVCSLRSVDPFDVSIIAQKFNGGGHERASAFRLNNLQDLKHLLELHGNSGALAFDSPKNPLIENHKKNSKLKN